VVWPRGGGSLARCESGGRAGRDGRTGGDGELPPSRR
jgi:hypothetical protein